MSQPVRGLHGLMLVPGWHGQLPAGPLPGHARSRPAGAPGSRRAAGRARRRPVVASAALTAALAGCGGQAAVALPQKAGSATGGPAAITRPLTPRQQVAAAYLGYWQAYAAAMTAQNPGRARSILAPYNPAADIPEMIRSLRQVWAAHEIAYGGAAPHILSVQVTGRSARLHDCLDLSHFGAEDIQTSQVVAGSFGHPRLNFYVALVLLGGRWRVSNMQLVEVPCVP